MTQNTDWSDRITTISAKLVKSNRPELEYISEILGLEVNGKSDVQLRNGLIGLMDQSHTNLACSMA